MRNDFLKVIIALSIIILLVIKLAEKIESKDTELICKLEEVKPGDSCPLK